MADVTMHPSLMPKLVPSLLWCEGVGGDNQFVDGFAVAEKIRTEEPEVFRLLRQAAVPALSAGANLPLKFSSRTSWAEQTHKAAAIDLILKTWSRPGQRRRYCHYLNRGENDVIWVKPDLYLCSSDAHVHLLCSTAIPCIYEWGYSHISVAAALAQIPFRWFNYLT